LGPVRISAAEGRGVGTSEAGRRDAVALAAESCRRAVALACEHDFQWHPLSDDFGTCSKCGETAEECQ
jgi:hypothetical protein